MKHSLKKDSFEHFELKKNKVKLRSFRCCNICGEPFNPNSRFERYCRECKDHHELFKYGSWLPDMDDQLVSRFL